MVRGEFNCSYMSFFSWLRWYTIGKRVHHLELFQERDDAVAAFQCSEVLPELKSSARLLKTIMLSIS